MFLALSALLIVGNRAVEEAVAIGVDSAVSEDLDSALKLEIEQLKSKISTLESTTLEKASELKSKDEKIAQLESVIQEKAESVVSLQSKIELLQKKEVLDVENLVEKAQTRSSELEEKVERLKNEIDTQNRRRETLEAQAIIAERKEQELNLKLRKIEKMNDEQKQKIQKTERALQVAEEELARVRREASSKFNELKEVHGAWLPPWLAYHIMRCQKIAETHWNDYGNPAWVILVQKVSEKSDQAQKWVEPHLEAAKTKWIPVVKAKWIAFTVIVRPHIDNAYTKAVEIFEQCRANAKSRSIVLQEFANPYVQEARKYTKPYVELVATLTKPYVGKASTFLKPYTRMVVHGYGNFLKIARTYHHQAQNVVMENLEKHDITKSLATKELVWFVASASLALPIFLIYNILSIFFGKKVAKPVRGARSHNHHRRHKRRHAD